ncbi:MAG: cell division protein SepF [Candidatus Bathycorpusculaceae bacterium]
MREEEALRSKSKKAEGKKAYAKNVSRRIFFESILLTDLSELEFVKSEVRSGNIVIIRVTPLASKNIEDVGRAVNELCDFIQYIGGDIGRLGEERIVICPPNVKIRRPLFRP